MNTETHTCVYCGAPATHQFKNGKWCCQEKRSQCPANRERVAKAMTLRHKEAKEKYGTAVFSQQRSVSLYPSKHPSRGDHICVYCGGYADYKLKNGRWCCQPSHNSCPANRAKNSAALHSGPCVDALRKAHEARRGKPSWNKGLTFDKMLDLDLSTNEELESLRNRIRSGLKKARLDGRLTGRASTPELELARRQKIAAYAKGHSGGYRKGSGRGKKGWYQGIFCDSSWELAYVIYCKENGKSIRRCDERRSYSFGGVKKTYLPDFVVDGRVIEIKGYQTEQWKCKQAANPDVVVLGKDEMQPILDFVIAKYGKDFIRLYERRDG